MFLLKITFLSLALVSCSNSDTSDGNDKEGEVATVAQSTSPVVLGPDLYKAYPLDFVVSSPYAPEKGSNNLDTESTYDDYKSLVAESWAKLSSTTAASCITKLTVSDTDVAPSCFGPAIDYAGHPDGAPESGSYALASLPMWSPKLANKEACSANKVNYQTKKIALYANLGLDAIQMVYCLGNIAGLKLPATNEASVNLTSSVNALIGESDIGGEITSAISSRLDDTDGNTIYITELSVTRTDESILKSTLTHFIRKDDVTLYKGKMQTTITPKESSTDKIIAVSASYEKASDTLFKSEVRKTKFVNGTSSDAIFDINGYLEKPADNSGYEWSIQNINPADGSGKYALSWLDGSSTNNIHSFVGSLAIADKAKTGCGYFGSGDTLDAVYADKTRASWLDRIICNPGPNGSTAGQAYLQKQCIGLSAITGLYEVISSNINFIPRDSCGESIDDNSGFSWRIIGTSGSYNVFSGKHDLLPISGITAGDITAPIAPIEW